MTDQEKMREEFEDAVLRETETHNLLRDTGVYVNGFVREAWNLWQACAAQSAEKIARLEAEKAMIQKVADDRFAIMQLEAERLAATELSNKQLLETSSALIEVVKDYLQEVGPCDHSIGICMCAEYRLVDKAEQLLRQKPSMEVLEQEEGYPGIAHDFETTKLNLVATQADNSRLRQWILQHGEHEQSCEVFNIDDAGYHYACTCGFEQLLAHQPSTEALDAYVAKESARYLVIGAVNRKGFHDVPPFPDGSRLVYTKEPPSPDKQGE